MKSDTEAPLIQEFENVYVVDGPIIKKLEDDLNCIKFTSTMNCMLCYMYTLIPCIPI